MQCGRPGFDPWVVEIPWKRERLPTAVFWPGEFHGLYIHGVAESDATEWLSLFITSVLSFLIAELLFRNFSFYNLELSLAYLSCQSYWYCQLIQFLVITLDFFFAFRFCLPPSWFRTLHFYLDYCSSLFTLFCRFVCCFYPVLFLPFSTPVSTGSGSCRASRSPCFAVSMPFCTSLPEKAPLWLCRNPDFSLRPRSTSYFSLKLSLAVTVTAHTHILFF